MLTEGQVRELLTAGYWISDREFAEHVQERMARSVYLMAHFLSDPPCSCLEARELQERIRGHLLRAGVPFSLGCNPVDWFSALWTSSEKGKSPQHFRDEYRELFTREGTKNFRYGINKNLSNEVAGVIRELGPLELNGTVQELDSAGVFTPVTDEDARRWCMRAILLRRGQPQFRAKLLKAYRGLCAVTRCNAVDALEAAHIKPYDGPVTNVVSNGILLRADLHTLFDLNLIGIDPKDHSVRVSHKLRGTVYRELDGSRLCIPNDPDERPDSPALEARWMAFNEAKEAE